MATSFLQQALSEYLSKDNGKHVDKSWLAVSSLAADRSRTFFVYLCATSHEKLMNKYTKGYGEVGVSNCVLAKDFCTASMVDHMKFQLSGKWMFLLSSQPCACVG
jgi:hypothetical protein